MPDCLFFKKYIAQCLCARNKKDGEKAEDPKPNDEHGTFLFETRDKIKVTANGSDLEYVTPAVNTAAETRDAGDKAGNVHRRLKMGLDPGLPDTTGFYRKMGCNLGILRILYRLICLYIEKSWRNRPSSVYSRHQNRQDFRFA